MQDPFCTYPQRTVAEAIEDLRFQQLLAGLDQPTALLLLLERIRWRLAEDAKACELAQRAQAERVLREIHART